MAALSPAGGALDRGLAGVMLESGYINVPRPRFGATRVFPCRFHLRPTEDRTRLAQSCD